MELPFESLASTTKYLSRNNFTLNTSSQHVSPRDDVVPGLLETIYPIDPLSLSAKYKSSALEFKGYPALTTSPHSPSTVSTLNTSSPPKPG